MKKKKGGARSRTFCNQLLAQRRIVDDAPDEATPAEVIIKVGTNLHLEVVEAAGECGLGQVRDLLVRVAEPAGGGDVGRIAGLNAD